VLEEVLGKKLEGTGTPNDLILNFLQHFPHGLFLILVSTKETVRIKLHCMPTNKINIRYTLLYTGCRL